MDVFHPDDLAPEPIRDALTAPLGPAHGAREATLHWKRKCEAAEARESALIEELETERMRLAACGVVAMANTPESAQRARDVQDEYRSASIGDVERAVDREMALIADKELLTGLVASLTDGLKEAREAAQNFDARCRQLEGERDALQEQLNSERMKFMSDLKRMERDVVRAAGLDPDYKSDAEIVTEQRGMLVRQTKTIASYMEEADAHQAENDRLSGIVSTQADGLEAARADNAILQAENARMREAITEVWESIPCTYDHHDPMVKRHAAALNALDALRSHRTEPTGG